MFLSNLIGFEHHIRKYSYQRLVSIPINVE
jgi:hypothetical protein